MEISYPALLLIALVSAFGLGIIAHMAWIERTARSAKEPSTSECEDWRRIFGQSERGSVFTVLMVGVGMAATLSIATYQILTGPVASVARVTQHNLAKNQMITINRIALMDAVLQPANGDCDTDGYIEPRAWRTTTGAKPTNGGLLPLAMGAPTSDPWMSEYGYCVWDVGTLSAQAGCGGATGRLDGADNPVSGNAKTLTVMAVISSGPDRVFQTTCNAYVDANTDLISIAANSDDLIQRYTYAEASASGGGEGLWFLKSGDPTTATIDRSIEIGGSGVVQATAVNTSGKIVAGGGVELGRETTVTSCTAISNVGVLRYNEALQNVEVCKGVEGWVTLGGTSASWNSASDASTSTRTVNSYGDPGTGSLGPSITVQTGDTAVIAVTSQMTNGSPGESCFVGVEVTGDTPAMVANDNASLRLVTGSGTYQVGGTFRLTGLTPGNNIFTLKYKASAGTCSFSNRVISAMGDLPLPCSSTIPNAIAFANQTGVTAGATIESNIVQVTGISCPVATSVSGSAGSPQHRICSDAACASVIQGWTAAASTIRNNQYVQLRMTASTNGSTRSANFGAGGTAAAPWTVTSISDCITGTPPVGTVCADGTVYAGISADGNVKMFTTPYDLGMTGCSNGATYKLSTGSQSTTGITGTTSGSTNTASWVALGIHHQAAKGCDDLVTLGHSDWYLPSSSEASTMLNGRNAIGCFDDTGANVHGYWSSSESIFNGDQVTVYVPRVGYMNVEQTTKGNNRGVRCVRK